MRKSCQFEAIANTLLFENFVTQDEPKNSSVFEEKALKVFAYDLKMKVQTVYCEMYRLICRNVYFGKSVFSNRSIRLKLLPQTGIYNFKL